MLYNRVLVSLLLVAAACKGGKVRVASGRLDTLAFLQFRTFAVKAPQPRADSLGVSGKLDPMQPTSVAGRAIRQDVADAFTRRGYHVSGGQPDFYVTYDAGIGDSIVVAVQDARNDSVVWRGADVARKSNSPGDYTANIHAAVNRIVENFPEAHR